MRANRSIARVIRPMLVVIALASLLAGCFLTDVLPGTETKKTSPSKGGKKEETEEKPKNPPPEPLSGARLLRRMSLDLTLRLPEPQDVDALLADPEALDGYVDALLASPEVPRAFARWHEILWRLEAKGFDDLEAFVDAGDTDLKAALTPSTRKRIAEEPLLFLRHGLERGVSFPELFTRDFTIAHPSVLSLWGQTANGTPWPGEPYRFAGFDDGRPAIGLLGVNGLLAKVRSGTSGKAYEMFRLLACMSLEKSTAHDFLALTAEELNEDLSVLARNKANCAGCHAQIGAAADVMKGLAQGNDFDAWKRYTASSVDGAHYSGHPLTDLADLAAKLGKDPRVHRCEVTRLMSAFMQRAYNSLDERAYAQAMRDFYAENMTLPKVAGALIGSDEYRYKIVGKAVKGEYLRSSTGVRLLNKLHWEGILRQLGPTAATLEVPAGLTPGADETVTFADGVPSGSYWHATLSLARQAASAIVADELQDDTLVESRSVLTLLPDGSGRAIATDDAMAQVRAVYKFLTAAELDPAGEKHAQLTLLWKSALNGKTADEDYRRAWRTMLTALLTDLDFLRY